MNVNWLGDLYNIAQLALREVVGGIAGVEALLNQRLEISTQLLARVRLEGARLALMSRPSK